MDVDATVTALGLQWFGDSWGAPVCAPDRHAATPAGAPCAGLCGRTIGAADQGVMLPLAGELVDVAVTERITGHGSEEGLLSEYAITWLGWHLDCWIREIGGPCRTHGVIRCDGTGRSAT